MILKSRPKIKFEDRGKKYLLPVWKFIPVLIDSDTEPTGDFHFNDGWLLKGISVRRRLSEYMWECDYEHATIYLMPWSESVIDGSAK